MFVTYLKIGTFTVGGGYAMLPMVEHEVVEKKHWIEQDEFMNVIALAQAAPGIFAVNTAIFVGWRLAGWKGIAVTVLGAVLPSFAIILCIAMVFTDFKDNPNVEAVFKGVRPAVVALILGPRVKMAKMAHLSWSSAIIPAVAIVLIWPLHLSPIWVILITVGLAIIFSYFKQKGGIK